jgi:hypothetical protein
MDDYDFDGLSTQEIAETQEREDRKQAKRARIHTLKDLLHEQTEQADPLLGPLVRRGQTTMIGGYAGSGKSTISLELVRAIVTGGDFLGWEGEGQSALIVDLEQGMSVAQRRIYESFTGLPLGDFNLMDLVADMDFPEFYEKVRYADWQEGADLFTHSPDIEVLEEELEEHRPDVVLIDPVYKLFMGRDMNDQVEISSFIREIQLLRNKFGFALIMPMHPRKMAQGGSGVLSMHDLYGSMNWGAWAENIVMIQRGEDNIAKLRWEKDRMGQSPATSRAVWNLTYEPGRGYRRDAGEATEGAATADVIYNWLRHPERRGQWYERKDFQEALELSRDLVAQTTARMEERKGRYGNLYPGMVIEHVPGHPNRYSFNLTPREQDVEAVLEDFKDVLDATEEIPW